MSHQITNAEYKRRVFNAALLEAIRKPYLEALGENTSLKGEPINELYLRGTKDGYVNDALYKGTAGAVLGAGVGAVKGRIALEKLKKAGASDAEIAEAKKNIGKEALKGAGVGAAAGAAIGVGQNAKVNISHAVDRAKRNKTVTEASQPALVSNGATEAAPTNPDGSEKKPEKDKKPLNSCGPEDAALAESMCDSYFTEELRLTESTISQTKERLRAANRYITEAVAECEEIADKHAEEARKEDKTFGDDEKIELTPEDNEVLDQLFHSKGPGPQIDQIRDATVKALISEEKKAKEVRDALDLAQSKVSTGDTNAYNETASRISKVGPTSLMGAIMNSFGRAAVNETSNAGRFTSVGEVLAENADLIKTRSVMLYAIMETGNQLEITHMNSADVERLARNIFYQK